MSNDGGASPAGLRRMRIWVVVVAVLVVAALASAATAALRGPRSPAPPEQATAGRSDQPVSGGSTPSTAGPSATPAGTPEASPAPAAAATTTAPAPAPRQSTLLPKPRVTSFSATADGLIVTVTFTVEAQADRGPFRCTVKRNGSAEVDHFPCAIGQVSRTYNFEFCCETTVFVTVMDRYNVSSDPWRSRVAFPKPAQPTYQNLRGWSDDGTVHVTFDVVSAPGDDPVCDIDIYHHPSGYHFQQQSQPCEGTTTISFAGDGGICLVHINVRSDTYRFTEGSSQRIEIQ